ncbi:unnamed protein product [Durusdinium trenchii]|uniref:Uncharacterized protein n=1 Tax=Durusdinium trenchii TaxID=1381693 RepID=A0ABP0NZB2_9DINO
MFTAAMSGCAWTESADMFRHVQGSSLALHAPAPLHPHGESQFARPDRGHRAVQDLQPTMWFETLRFVRKSGLKVLVTRNRSMTTSTLVDSLGKSKKNAHMFQLFAFLLGCAGCEMSWKQVVRLTSPWKTVKILKDHAETFEAFQSEKDT